MRTTLAESIVLTCPQCNTEFSADIWQIVDANERPDLIEQILNEDVNRVNCPNCDFQGFVLTPLLLFDHSKNIPIIFSPHPNVVEEVDSRAALDDLIRKLRQGLQQQWQSHYVQEIPFVHRALLSLAVQDVNILYMVELFQLIESCKGHGDSASAARFVQENPVILSDGAQVILETMIAFFERFGDPKSKGYQTCLDLLVECKEVGVQKVIEKKEQAEKAFWGEHPELQAGLEKILKEAREEEIEVPRQFEPILELITAAQTNLAFDQAAHLWEQIINHPDFAHAQKKFRWATMHDAGTYWLRSYQLEAQKQKLNRAVFLLKHSLELSGTDNANLLTNLGTALALRYKHLGDSPDDLDEAIYLFARATDPIMRRQQPDYAQRLCNFGASLVERYERDLRKNDLMEALKWLKEARRETQTDAPYQPMILTNLANATRLLFFSERNIADLEDAIELSEQATSLIDKTISPLEYADTIFNLGGLYIERYQLSEQLRIDLESELYELNAAIQRFKEAIHISPKASPRLAGYKMNLGMALVMRFEHGETLLDLEDGFAKLREAIDETEINSADYADFLNNYVGVVMKYSDQLGGKLETAEIHVLIEKFETVYKRNSSDPAYAHNLGQLYFNRHERLGDPTDFEQGQQMLQNAIELATKTDPALAIQSARAFGIRLSEIEEWNEAAAAYGKAVDVAETIFRTQFSREYKETALRQIRSLHTYATYAYAKAENMTQAVLTAEWGHARLLTDALNQSQAGITQLSFSQIAAAAELAPLVYIGVANYGAFALVVHPDTVTPLWLPQLDFSALSERKFGSFNIEEIGGLMGAATHIASARREALREAQSRGKPSQETIFKFGQLKEKWLDELEQLLEWLWDVLMSPLLSELKRAGATKAVLIPHGTLYDLPLHATWTKDSSMPDGRRYALDEITFSYAPNAQALLHAQLKAANVGFESIFAVDNPTLDPYLVREANQILPFFKLPYKRLLYGDAAKITAVMEQLPTANVLHFNTHGSANPIHPLHSYLEMAKGERLTVQHFLDMQLNHVRLAVLSACETQIAGAALPEEVVSLPSALMQAGVPGIVGTLWPVNVDSTSQFVTKFYEFLKNEGEQPAIALQKAQQWMRQRHVTLDHWSAFVYTGV